MGIEKLKAKANLPVCENDKNWDLVIASKNTIQTFFKPRDASLVLQEMAEGVMRLVD